MILFCFIDHGPDAAVGMSLLSATAPEASLAEAQDVLRSHPGARAAHVFDGDMFVGTAEAPAFGFVGTNNETAMLLTDYGRVGDQADLKGWAARTLPVVEMHKHMVDELDEANADAPH